MRQLFSCTVNFTDDHVTACVKGTLMPTPRSASFAQLAPFVAAGEQRWVHPFGRTYIRRANLYAASALTPLFSISTTTQRSAQTPSRNVCVTPDESLASATAHQTWHPQHVCAAANGPADSFARGQRP
jgi:hypothetical protein